MVNKSLYGKGIELFTQDDKLFVIQNGTVKPFSKDCSEVITVLSHELSSDEKASNWLHKNGYEGNEALELFGKCRYGAFNAQADFIKGKSKGVEYINCTKRGSCTAEGLLCKCIEAPNGHISFREIEIIKLIAQDYSDKEIAKKLFISENTALTHVVNIRSKLGVKARPAVVAWAAEQGII